MKALESIENPIETQVVMRLYDEAEMIVIGLFINRYEFERAI